MLCLDPYEEARGGETVLHWACQCKEENETVVEKLLTFSVRCVLLTA